MHLLESFCALTAHSVKTQPVGEEVVLTNKFLTPHARKEAKLVAECLFYLYYCDPPGSELTAQLVSQNHLQQLIVSVDSFFTTDPLAMLHEVWLIQMLTVQAIFLLTLGGDRPAGKASEDTVLSSSFLDTMDATLRNMRNKDAQQVLQIAFAVLVRRRGPSVSSNATAMSAQSFSRACVDAEAFTTLTVLLKHPAYGKDDNLVAFGSVFDKLLTGLILGFLPELADIKRAEEERLVYEKERAQRGATNGGAMGMGMGGMGRTRMQMSGAPVGDHQAIVSAPEERPRRFAELMLLMQHAYKNQPTLSEKYWDFRGEKEVENKNLHHFLGMAGRDGYQVHTPEGFCLYMDLLSSFAGGADNNAYYGYMFVKTGLNEFVRLTKFFDVLGSYATEVSKGGKMDRKEEDVTIAILNFLQAILLGSEEVRRLLADGRERPLDVLKSLLMANVNPRVKAAVLDTLRAFAETAAIVPTLWMVLEVSGIVTPESGISLELLEETNLQLYPETIAFLKLLERLLSVSDARSLLEVTKKFRPEGSILGPYLKFVIDDVFLKNETRSFRNPAQQWEIFSHCLYIFLRILQRFDAVDFRANVNVKPGAASALKGSSSAVDVTNLRTVLSIATNPFYELMTRLLDGALLENVLSVARTGAQNSDLENARFGKPWGKAMEDACLASLCIVEEAASKEEFFEDLLDILDDWDQRKTDEAVNPLAALYSASGGLKAGNTGSGLGAARTGDMNQSFGGNPTSPYFGGGRMNASFGGFNKAEREVPAAVVALETRSVHPPLLRDFVLSQKGASLIAVCNFVDYAINLELPLHAVKILALLHPQIPSLVSVLAQSGRLPLIRLGFMNRLEDVHPSAPVREEILQLLLASIRSQRPNLGQVLLGYAPFDTDDEPEALTAINAAYLRQQQLELAQKQQTQQQQQQQTFNGNPGSLNTTASAASSLLDASVLRNSESRRSGDSANVWDETRGYCLGLVLDLLRSGSLNAESSELAQLCYRLVYILSATSYTSPRIMAYLRRSSHAFLLQHLNRLSVQRMSADPVSRINQLDQLSWLMQTVALEIHVTASSGREFLAQGLLQELFSIPSAESINNNPDTSGGWSAVGESSLMLVTEADLLDSSSRHYQEQQNLQQKMANLVNKPHNRMKMVELLDALDAFEVPQYTPLRDSDIKVFRGLDLDSCRVMNAKGRKVIDLVYLHRVLQDFQVKLHDEGSSLVRNTADHSTQEIEEQRLILTDALKQNQYAEALMAKQLLFDSWKKVLQVAVIECYANLGAAEVEPYLFELIEILLVKLTHFSNTYLPLLESMADTCLVLITKLREQVSYTSLGVQGVDNLHRFTRTPLERLHAILVGALSSIVDKTPSSASLRGTLYAFLVNYFQFARLVQGASLDGNEDGATLAARNGYALRSVGERFLEKLVGDCSFGPDSWKAIGLAALNVIIARPDPETSNDLVQILSRKGFINFFSSLRRFEEPLRRCLRDPDHPLNTLFVWESQLSLLIRIAQTPAGTLLLTQGGLLASLVDLAFIDSRPAVELASDMQGWYPTLIERYEQAMEPVGTLLTALLTSSEEAPNADVVRHVLEFLTVHARAVTDILEDNYQQPTLSSLKLLRVFCSLFYSLAPFLHRVHGSDVSSELQRHAAHFRDLLLNLLHKYCAYPEMTGTRLPEESSMSLAALGAADERGMEVLAIRKFLMGYFRSVSSAAQGDAALIFSPQLRGDCSRPPTKSGSSLSLLAFYLYHSQSCLAQLGHAHSAIEIQLLRAQRSEMLPGEIAKLMENSGAAVSETSMPMKQRIVIGLLGRQIKDVEDSRKAHQFIIENCLWLLLAHLEVYGKNEALRDKLSRAAGESDRVGLSALVTRLASSEDEVVYDLVRRVRACLMR